MSNLAEFNGSIDAFMGDTAEDELRRFVERISLEVLKRVVQRTPVDTGRARGNWQSSAGQPKTSELDVTDKSGGLTIAQGAAIFAAETQPFGVNFVSNNVPYIYPLENGSSKQAPEGMVALTVTEIESAFENVTGDFYD